MASNWKMYLDIEYTSEEEFKKIKKELEVRDCIISVGKI